MSTKTKIKGGCTLWARKTFESDIFYLKPDKWFKIWFYLIGKVSHTGNSKFKRGEGYFKYEWIMRDCKATKAQVDHFFRWSKSATMIATRKATRGFYVTILNYYLNKYIYFNKSDTKSDSKSDIKATLYNKKDKNIRTTISFNRNSGEFEGLPNNLIEKWKKLYVFIDVEQKIKELASWRVANPNKHYKNNHRFLVNNLSRENGEIREKRGDSMTDEEYLKKCDQSLEERRY